MFPWNNNPTYFTPGQIVTVDGYKQATVIGVYSTSLHVVLADGTQTTVRLSDAQPR